MNTLQLQMNILLSELDKLRTKPRTVEVKNRIRELISLGEALNNKYESITGDYYNKLFIRD